MRPMTAADLPAVARIHKAVYPRSHTTAHFPLWLLEALYWTHLRAGAIALVAGDPVAGFVVGGEAAALTQAMRAFRRHYRFALARTVLTHPVLWPELLRRPKPGPPGPSMRLLSIAVAQRGLGRELALAFGAACGAREYGTTTRPDNVAAQRFFRSLGGQTEDGVAFVVPVAESPEPR